MLWYFKALAHRPHLILLFVGTLCVACIVVSLTTERLPDFSDPTLGFEARGTQLGQRITAWHNLLDETRPAGGQLIANPYEYFEEDEDWQARKSSRKQQQQQQQHQRHNKRRKNKKKNKKTSLVLTEKIQLIKNVSYAQERKQQQQQRVNSLPLDEDSGTSVFEGSGRRDDSWEYGRNVSFIDDDDDEAANKSIQMKKDNWMKLSKGVPPPFQTDIHTSSDGFFCESPSE